MLGGYSTIVPTPNDIVVLIDDDDDDEDAVKEIQWRHRRRELGARAGDSLMILIDWEVRGSKKSTGSKLIVGS